MSFDDNCLCASMRELLSRRGYLNPYDRTWRQSSPPSTKT